MMPVLTPEATEGILAAVIQRINATSGQICHEETIGDYASYQNMLAGHPEMGNTPLYVYTMVDTDFLLLPVLADYAAASPDRARAFLARNSTLVNGTFAELLNANIENVLVLAAPFGAVSEKQNLVKLRAFPVGNWRDSAAGLGYGMYPFDVNCALVPAALEAIKTLSASGMVPATYNNASTYLSATWEANACDQFKISISSADASTALNQYITAANLSSTLLYGAGSLNDSVNSTTDGGWAAPEQLIGGSSAANSTFYALSLLPETEEPVPVLNSDLSFVLEYADPDEVVLWATVQALQAYPRGLLTNAGMVVANGAYDTRNASGAAKMFANTAYHGAVSWSWQSAMMAQGLSKQLGRCGLSANTQLNPIDGSGAAASGAGMRKRQSTEPSEGSGTSDPAAAVDETTTTISTTVGVETTPPDTTSPATPSNLSPTNTSPATSGPAASSGTGTGTVTGTGVGVDGTQLSQRPSWCDNANLTAALQQAQLRLWDSIQGSASVLWTEVWSPVWTFSAEGNVGANRFAIGDLGAISGDGTEGDAFQLWSYAFLALVDPRTGRPAAAGFDQVPGGKTAIKSAATRDSPAWSALLALAVVAVVGG